MFLDYNELNTAQVKEYQDCVQQGFPNLILQSKIVQTAWAKVEKYFPQCQRYLFDDQKNLIGFINTIPFYWNSPLTNLPDTGWDWLIQKGIHDFEQGEIPNCLGGLQVVLSKSFKSKGYSKELIAEGKRLKEHFNLDHLVIPIRPNFKHKFPEMKMEEYMVYKPEGKIYDPWIRTHMKSGAKFLSICTNSMNVQGDISFWEALFGNPIKTSGNYIIPGGLNPVFIQVENNHGEYREDNIWLYYD